MAIARSEKFRFPDQSVAESRFPRRLSRIRSLVLCLFVRWKNLLDGLEKSQARAASLPCSKFYCWFYVRELVDRGEQLACWPRFAPFSRVASFLPFLLFFRFSFFAALTSLPRGFSFDGRMYVRLFCL